MFQTLELTRMAQALAAHAGARLGVIAGNVANADTPGYRRRDIPDFASLMADDGATMRATRPGHIAASAGASAFEARVVAGAGSPDGNTVSLEQEMVHAAEARQEHDMALAIFRATSDVIRLSLGRSR